MASGIDEPSGPRLMRPGFTESMSARQWRLLWALLVLLLAQLVAMVLVVING